MAYEAKIVEFPEERRVSQLKNLSWEGYRYFLENVVLLNILWLNTNNTIETRLYKLRTTTANDHNTFIFYEVTIIKDTQLEQSYDKSPYVPEDTLW